MRLLPTLFILLLFIAACQHPMQQTPHAPFVIAQDSDSIGLTQRRHYGIDFNLIVHTDSLMLVEDRPMHWSEGATTTTDTLWLRNSNRIVVAAITSIPEDTIDSIWVKVARDQLTMGWLHEQDLLTQCVPDDPISEFIYHFSVTHTRWFLLTMVLALGITGLTARRHRDLALPVIRDIASPYPTLVLIALAASAMLYAYIQEHEPLEWVHFYFYPTLNPLTQPTLLCAFLLSFWVFVLLSIAAFQDVTRLLPLGRATAYLLALLAECMAVYLVVSWLGISIPSMLLLAVCSVGLLVRYKKLFRARYLCGQCGRALTHEGTCPHCGAINTL